MSYLREETLEQHECLIPLFMHFKEWNFYSENAIMFSDVMYPIEAPFLFARHKAGECYLNAFNLMLCHEDLIYVEGYVSTGIFALHHAWCCDQDLRVIDPTFNHPKSKLYNGQVCQYLGVPIAKQFVTKRVFDRKITGILGENNKPMYAIELGEDKQWQKENPSLKQQLKDRPNQVSNFRLKPSAQLQAMYEQATQHSTL